jgi:hypothetical protein
MHAPRALTAALAVAVLVGSQLAALAHTAAIRHVLCDEHGEQLEAPTLIGPSDDCPQTHLVGVQGTGGEHEDCPIARLLGSSLDPLNAAPAVELPAIATHIAGPPPNLIVDTLDLVLIAPKTSPPRC